MSFYEKEDRLALEHDYHFNKFIETRDFKHFEAAKAIARRLIDMEERLSAYRHSPSLKRMYFHDREA